MLCAKHLFVAASTPTARSACGCPGPRPRPPKGGRPAALTRNGSGLGASDLGNCAALPVRLLVGSGTARVLLLRAKYLFDAATGSGPKLLYAAKVLRPIALMRAERLPTAPCLSSLTVPPRATSGLSRSWCLSASISPFAVSCARASGDAGSRDQQARSPTGSAAQFIRAPPIWRPVAGQRCRSSSFWGEHDLAPGTHVPRPNR